MQQLSFVLPQDAMHIAQRGLFSRKM